MTELDSNIEAFNQYVKGQIRDLAARGETPNDLLINLFKGYKAANDVEFADFIRHKANAYEEGKDVDADNLLSFSLAKYRVCMLIDKWSALIKEQEQILALTAQEQELKSVKPLPASHNKQTQRPTDRQPPKQGSKDDKWAWKNIFLKAGELTTKDFGGKTYYVN